MTTVKVLLFYTALALCPSSARANSVDHFLAINPATACGIVYSCAPATGLTLFFSSTGSLHVLHYTNMPGVNWHSRIRTEVGEPAIDMTCMSNLFGCQIVPYGDHGTRIILMAFGNFREVGAGRSFEIGVSCEDDCLSWPSDVAFTAVAKGVPEPATAPMLLLGVVALFAWKRLAYGA